MRWAGHVARVGETRNAYRDHWEDQGVGGWTILKWFLERLDGMVWIGLIWLRIGTSEQGNELSGSIKCWEVLEWLHNWRLLKKGSAPGMSN
jgi:hypothetical protein